MLTTPSYVTEGRELISNPHQALQVYQGYIIQHLMKQIPSQIIRQGIFKQLGNLYTKTRLSYNNIKTHLRFRPNLI